LPAFERIKYGEDTESYRRGVYLENHDSLFELTDLVFKLNLSEVMHNHKFGMIMVRKLL